MTTQTKLHSITLSFMLSSDDGASGIVAEAMETLVDRRVDLELRVGGFPTQNVYVTCVDPDGDLVVSDVTDEQIMDGVAPSHSTWAIPQEAIREIRCPLGNAA